jgi:SP family myo-inositol transporter-like MFS transporter 13
MLLAGTVSIGGFLFGYDTGIISGSILLIKKDFELNDLQQEWIIASATAGAMAGALLGGFLNDLIGRKPATMTAALIFLASSLLMGLAPAFPELLVGRIIAGMGVGLASMTVPLYIAEVSPPEYRGALVSSNILFVTGGQFISYLVAAGLSLTDDGWRYMLGLGVLPATIQLVALLFLPESPRYLVKRGKVDKAREYGSSNLN